VAPTLWAISDLHTGHSGNKPITESLYPADPEDWLIVAGDVAGATVLLRDDLIASAGTLSQAAVALRQAGAAQVHALAAHGLFVGQADRVLADAPLDSLVVTDSVPPFRLPASCAAAARLQVVSAAGPLLAALRDSRDTFSC
jgi:ribose-phosphate pyrophosphokinase